MKKKNIYIIGAGGHAKNCIDIIESDKIFKILYLVDKKINKIKKILNYNIINEKSFLNKKLKNGNIVIGIGQIKNPDLRKMIYNFYKKKGFKFPNIISKFSHVSKNSKLGDGILIGHGAVINAFSKIGSNCIINNQSLIEHDVEIGKNCHVSTGVVINGSVKIGSNTFIGSGSIIRESIKIGNNCVIGSGLIIKKDIKPLSILKK